MKVDCVIGLCRVLDFGTATEAGGPNGRFGQRVKGWEGGSWKVGSQKPRFLWDVGGFTHMIFVWMLIATALPGLTGAHYDLCESDRRDHTWSGGRISWGAHRLVFLSHVAILGLKWALKCFEFE